MKPHEREALARAGVDPLIMRLAMDPEIPISYREAHESPISELLQLEIVADVRARIRRRQEFLAAHRRAMQAASRRRRGR